MNIPACLFTAAPGVCGLPSQPRYPVRWKPSLAGALAGMLLASSAVCSAQIVYGEHLPADADMDAIASTLALQMGAQGAASGGPIFYAQAEVDRQFDQAMLWCYRLQADDKLTSAMLTETFLGMQKQINTAVAAAGYLINKLKEDIAWFEERNGNFKNPAYRPSSKAEADDLARYNETKRRLDLITSPAGSKPEAIGLPDAAEEVKRAFDKLRTETLGSAKVVRQKGLQNAKSLASALAAFAGCAEKAEKLATSFMTIGKNAQAVASPRQQIRMDFTNGSPNLVFFIRMWTQDPATGLDNLPPVTEDGKTWRLRKDTEEWITLWPKDSTYKLSGAAKSTPQDTPLPNTFWFPAKLQDRLELRVATYGDFRKRVRWDPIVGAQVRPDLTSLRRGFYYMGYAVNQGEKDQILSRWFSMDDKYAWSFTRGVWSDGLGRTLRASTPEERKELRSMRTENWNMENDRLIWILPAGPASILSDPNMSASVKGDANIVHASGVNPQGEANPENGEGEISVDLSLW